MKKETLKNILGLVFVLVILFETVMLTNMYTITVHIDTNKVTVEEKGFTETISDLWEDFVDHFD